MNDSPIGDPLANARILVLFPHMVVPGGALNYTLQCVRLLAAGGARVGIVTMRADRSRVHLQHGVELISLEGPLTSSAGFWLGLPFWQQKIERAIDSFNPDLVVAQVFPANWWGWLYRRKRNVPLLWVCHEPSAFIHSDIWISAIRPTWKRVIAQSIRPVLKYLDLRLARFTDMVVANSRFTAAQLIRIYGINASGIAHPGIDFSIFAPDDTRREDAVVTVAALSRFKRVDFLIRVFARLLCRHTDLVYHIVGTGDEEGSLRRQAKDLGIADRVIFHGKLDSRTLASVERRSLLFLHGALGEPFGMAPLEAIACGTPVAAHNSGGPAEFMDDSCGRLIDGESEDEWVTQVSAYLDYLKANPEYFARVTDVSKNFSWDVTLLPFVRGVESLLSTTK